MTLPRIHISTGGTIPIYRQIVDQVRAAILRGQMAPGAQLPSVRALAEQLVINPNTVAKAYGDLFQDGLVNSQPGRGCFVSQRRCVYTSAEKRRRFDQALEVFVSEVAHLEMPVSEMTEAVRRKLRDSTRGHDVKKADTP